MKHSKFVCTIAFFSLVVASEVNAQSIEWSVVNPFRFYKKEKHFELHKAAYNRVLQASNGVRPADAIRKIERDLNAPGCTDQRTPDTCANTATDKYDERRRGWAAKSYHSSETCYDRDPSAGPSRHEKQCEREYDWGSLSEDYVRPSFHTVIISLPVADRERLRGRQCRWDWTPRPAEMNGPLNLDCGEAVTIKKVPYPSGVVVSVQLPEGPTIQEPIAVIDSLIVGLGDSFASGEGNPDDPIEIKSTWALVYNPQGPHTSAALPMRAAAGESVPRSERSHRNGTQDVDEVAIQNDKKRFFAAAADWLSADCHRSQYSYQFRVALQIAIENPKRAVTFVHLACTGGEITSGLFGPKDAREHLSSAKKVASQFDQLLDLVCDTRAQPVYENGARGTQNPGSPTYKYPMMVPKKYGQLVLNTQNYFVTGCRNGKLKRPIDLVMSSFGGNDIGFSALVGYSIMKQSGAIAPIVDIYEDLSGKRMTFGVPPAAKYLGVLDERFAMMKKALQELLKVAPDRVIQTSYQPIQYDAAGKLCSGKTGLDVHKEFRFDNARLKEVDRFTRDLFNRLECIADQAAAPNGRACPIDLATGQGTKFRFIKTHKQPEFAKRGICAVSPDADRREDRYIQMTAQNGGSFSKWRPERFHPYAERHRLFVSPNDAFMTANTHLDGSTAPSFDDQMNLGVATLYSGSFHPTAEAHAIIADAAFCEAVKVLNVKACR